MPRKKKTIYPPLPDDVTMVLVGRRVWYDSDWWFQGLRVAGEERAWLDLRQGGTLKSDQALRRHADDLGWEIKRVTVGEVL